MTACKFIVRKRKYLCAGVNASDRSAVFVITSDVRTRQIIFTERSHQCHHTDHKYSCNNEMALAQTFYQTLFCKCRRFKALFVALKLKYDINKELQMVTKLAFQIIRIRFTN